VDSSRSLPTGVVTFLLTDIEGSTRLWEREPDNMRQALARHDAIVKACVQRQHGHVVKSKGEGDSVFAVFERVRDAVTTALVLQCALAVEAWPTSTPLRVRMAIHTGQIEVHDSDYNGVSVNRCARLRALAIGGQVLLSGVTAQLTKEQLPAGATLRDLGTHQLKDLSAPERVWQLTHPLMPDRLAASSGPDVHQLSAPVPVVASRTAFVLTDHLNHSADGREWGRQVKRLATGMDADDEDGHIDCYTSPNVAALLNAQNERFRMPRLWEASVDQDLTPGDAIVACREVTTTGQVPIPTLTGMQHARFAVLCARAAYTADSDEDTEFGPWADGWLNGQDSSGIGARAMATALEAEADRGSFGGRPEEMMVANAARSAMHAAGLSLRGGREHAEENTRAIHFATEAVRTALRVARMDLPALAEEAVGSALPRGLIAPA
jgi:class 3 adenylate cyclase